MDMESTYDYYPQRLITLADLGRMIWRRKWLLVGLSVVITAAVAVFTLRLPKIYRTSAKILLYWNKENVIAIAPNQSLSSNFRREDQMAAEIEIMRSRDLAEKVLAMEKAWQDSGMQADNFVQAFENKNATGRSALIQKISPHVAPRANQSTPLSVSTILQNMQAGVVKNTNVVEISFEDQDSRRAARVVSHYIQAYADFRRQFYKMPSEISFLHQQIELTREKLQQLRKSLDAFRSQKQIVSLEEQKRAVLQQLAGLEAQLFEVTRRRAGQETRLNEFRAIWKARGEEGGLPLTSSVANWGHANSLLQQLIEQKVRRAALLEKYTEEYDEVVAANESIATVQKMLHDEVEKLLQIEEAALKSLQAEENILRNKATELRVELKDFPAMEQRFTDLSRDIGDYERIHSTLLQHQEQERLNEAKNRNEVTIRILSPAMAPGHPVKPNVQFNVSLAAVLSLFLGLGLAYFLENMNQSLKTPQEVEQLVGLNVLAQIRELPGPLLLANSRVNSKPRRTNLDPRIQKGSSSLPS